MSTISKTYRVDANILYENGKFGIHFMTVDSVSRNSVGFPDSFNGNMMKKFRDDLINRILIENNTCMSEILYRDRHDKNYFFMAYLMYLQVTLFFDSNSEKCIGYDISDPKRHSNLGSEFNRDDNNYS